MRGIWFICGVLALATGILGIVLPLLPTVPLMLLAAFCFGKSSEKAHQWLINHKTFGPPILEWRNNRSINLKAKRSATIAVALAFGISLAIGVPTHVLIIQAITLSCVLLFIWTRPN